MSLEHKGLRIGFNHLEDNQRMWVPVPCRHRPMGGDVAYSALVEFPFNPVRAEPSVAVRATDVRFVGLVPAKDTDMSLVFRISGAEPRFRGS